MSLDLTGFRLDRATPTPLYYQIERFLQHGIDSGQIAPGERLPPELELTELFGVSRATVRQAINDLVAKDALYRRKGKGTFVRAPKIRELSFQILDSFNGEMVRKGHIPRTQVLDFRVIRGVERINAILGLPAKDRLIYLRRLRFVDNEPVLYFETYLPYRDFAPLLGENLERQSLYALMETKCGARVNRVVRRIEVKNASREEAQHLGIRRGDAIFLVAFTGFRDQDVPVEYSVTRYRGDNNEFIVEIKR